MTQKQIEELAVYLAGDQQAHHSIGLQVGGMMGKQAKRFFALRDAFGVQSYASFEEAADQIRAAVKP